MDVSYKGQKVVVFIAEDGFVAILKKMAAPIVAVIVILRIPSEQPPHDSRDVVVATLEKNMNMVPHQDPRVDPTFAFDDESAESLQESHPILVVFEDRRLIDPPYHDMVQRAWNVQCGLTWHVKSISELSIGVGGIPITRFLWLRCAPVSLKI